MKSFFLLLTLLINIAISQEVYPAPKFTIDISEPLEQRFTEIIDAYNNDDVRNAINGYIATVVKNVPNLAIEAIELIAKELAFTLGEQGKEMEIWADGLGINRGLVVALNFMYELRGLGGGRPNTTGVYYPTACTSIVAPDPKGVLYHARNMDWGLPNAMRNLTYECEWVNGNEKLFTGSCFVGFSGILTGYKPGKYAFSIDERDMGGNIILDALEAIIYGSWSPTHLLREVLLTENSYEDAVKKLQTDSLSAPVYFIGSGMKESEGIVITRDRESTRDNWLLDLPTRWYLLETNYDHWDQPPKIDDRRKYGNQFMEKLGRDGVSADALYEVVSTWPLNNEHTAYTAVMSAPENIFKLYIRLKKEN